MPVMVSYTTYASKRFLPASPLMINRMIPRRTDLGRYISAVTQALRDRAESVRNEAVEQGFHMIVRLQFYHPRPRTIAEAG